MNGSSTGPLPALYRFAIGCGLRPPVRGTPKSLRNAGTKSDSNLRTREREYVPGSTYFTASRKRIALVAHDHQKEKLAAWVSRQRARLSEHDLYATAHTADVIAAALAVPVF